MTYDPFEGEDFSWLEREAAIASAWPEGLQELVDMGLVRVTYDENDKAVFSLTESGRQAALSTDPNLN